MGVPEAKVRMVDVLHDGTKSRVFIGSMMSKELGSGRTVPLVHYFSLW